MGLGFRVVDAAGSARPGGGDREAQKEGGWEEREGRRWRAGTRRDRGEIHTHIKKHTFTHTHTHTYTFAYAYTHTHIHTQEATKG